MKLQKIDIETRATVTVDKSIKADGVNGIMKFGEKNDYPDIIEGIINSSKTAKSAAKIYAKFLSGGGFENDQINNIQIGTDYRGKKITIRSLLKDISFSFAYFYGAYIKLNINIDMQVTGAYLIPFKYCRLAKLDDSGYTAKIGVHPNWCSDGDGKKFKKDDIAWYNVFNLNPDVFNSQVVINDNGEIVNGWNGQIYFQYIDNQYIYPLSPFDPVYLDCDTESQMSMYMNNAARNGMTAKTIMRMPEPENDEEKAEIEQEFKNLLGCDGNNAMILYDELDRTTGQMQNDGSFKIDSITSSVDSSLFDSWHTELSNSIRKSPGSMPAILIDYEESKLGTTSGEAIIQATNFYNAMTSDDRDTISSMFAEIFQHSDNELLKNNTNWKIKKLNLYENEPKSLQIR